MKRSVLILAAVGALLAGAILWPSAPAQAFAPPMSMWPAIAAVGPAFIDSYRVTCATTATSVAPASGNALAIQCFAPESGETGGTTIVGVGDSGLADPAFATRTSPVMCGSGCNQTSLPANAKGASCRADSGTVDIFCWALVSTAP